MDGLLRKKDLVELVGVAKSTVADWITEFHVFIPTVKHGAVTYYKPEVLDVLNAIRELRELDQSKVQIMELLSKKGFPITVEEAVADVERVVSGADSRDTLLTVMKTMGQAVVKIGEQDGRINRLESTVLANTERMDGQDGRISETSEQVVALMRRVIEAESRAARAEVVAAEAKEQASKPWWKNWRR